MNILEKAKQIKSGTSILLAWAHDGEVVEKSQAQSRLEICSKCPKNSEVQNMTSEFSWAVRRIVELRHGLDLKLDGEENLKICSACLCDLKSKVWLPLQQIYPTEEMKQQLDPKCWLLNE